MSLPLLAIAALLGFGASNRGRRAESVGASDQVGTGVKVSKTIAGTSVTLIAVPFALAAILLCVYGLFVVIHWLSY